ncbi:uncharacterized protein LOC115742672 isoform X1 [Rhodamnia argentea]|uniref:Uncharacterized protein LOC115742672 isoform X1 n=1 Tax=Rhodamnia argentea TaxID=178133 RepID=A0A8B8PFT8_9MYRT|nr:uncharacterized protein LOC115742672 isoform X1 [Rhodamnia argentea]XP_030532959.1 uncharacterized protein LOC115742672 isoform X1 [Rhodamnia argentea]XP_048127236.1 uncharacterized protein LOC115742672 isoform X1 [Rhodamnia argentea]
MSVAKVKTSNALDGMKVEDGNDSLNTFIRQAIGKEPLLSLPRSGDSPVQWIQLLHALDHQDLPGWPLLSPLKIPMQKCDKCNREFFSSINYRRHIRVHHRLRKLDKDSSKNRDLLGAFWDKLSADEAKEIVSLKNSTMEDVPGATVIKSLASLIRKPGFPVMPQFCIKAGSSLLDIIQARPLRFPLSSQELFAILDDASEKTFLSGPTLLMQRYIFDKEVGKIGLETKNLVAFTCFMLEQKLVEAWLADKDAEALRFQKLLVEEEEAAQRRQAEILERKRQKRLRQKEQKAKDQKNGEKVNLEDSFDITENEASSDVPGNLSSLELDIRITDAPSDPVPSSLEVPQLPDSEEGPDFENEAELGSDYSDFSSSQTVEPQRALGGGHQHLRITSWHVPRKQCPVSGALHEFHGSNSSKLEFKHKHVNQDSRAAYPLSSKKVWSRKLKPEKEDKNLKLRVHEAFSPAGLDKKHELLIGSIAVALRSPCSPEDSDNLVEIENAYRVERQVQKQDIHSLSGRPDTLQCVTNQPRGKLWRPVSRNGVKDSVIENGNRASEVDENAAVKDDCQTLADENLLISARVDGSDHGNEDSSAQVVAGNPGNLEFSSHSARAGNPGNLEFSSQSAQAFLAERWKEAIAADHVKLLLLPESEPPGSPKTQTDSQGSPEFGERSILGNAENRIVNGGNFGSLASGIAKVGNRERLDKSFKKKYIPKQRGGT